MSGRSWGKSHKYSARKSWACENCRTPSPQSGNCPKCGHELTKFDSKAERNHWYELALLQDSGLIAGMVIQPRFPIVIEGVEVGRYYGDFAYTDEHGAYRVIDVKGQDTALSRFKRKCVKAQYGIDVEIVKK